MTLVANHPFTMIVGVLYLELTQFDKNAGTAIQYRGLNNHRSSFLEEDDSKRSPGLVL